MTLPNKPGDAPPRPMAPKKPIVKPAAHQMAIAEWPKTRLSQGLGLSIKDGWNVGIGFGLAMAIAVPIILLLLSCIIWTVLLVLGTSLTGLL